MSIINYYKDDILLIGIANIFSDLSHKLLRNFSIFMSFRKKKVSYKFF